MVVTWLLLAGASLPMLSTAHRLFLRFPLFLLELLAYLFVPPRDRQL